MKTIYRLPALLRLLAILGMYTTTPPAPRTERRHVAVSGANKDRSPFAHDFRREHLRRIKFNRARG